MDIQELKDKLRENRNKQKDFIENNELNSENEQTLANMEAEEKKLEKQLALQEKEERLEAAAAGQYSKGNGEEEGETRSNDQIYKEEVFPKILKNGFDINRLSEEERKVYDDIHGRADAKTRADLGTGSSGGGNLVPPELQNEIIETLSFFGGAREFGRIIRTATGVDLDWPTTDQTAVKGSIIEENPASDAATTNPTFGSKKLKSFTYTSEEILVSNQLLQDSDFDLVRVIREMIAERIARILNEHFTTGDGNSKPSGVVTDSTFGVTTSGTDAVTRTELVDLIHSVDRAYRTGNAQFMMNDSTLAAIKKLSFGSSDDRPLWQPSMREGVPDRLEGYPYVINNEMDDLGSGNKPILFGNGDKFLIRDVSGMSLMRLNELHAKKNQTGWIAFQRHDCKLMDTAAVKHLRNTTT